MVQILLPQPSGPLAQLVEQRTENPCVVGSIPTGTTIRNLSEICDIDYRRFRFFYNIDISAYITYTVSRRITVKGGDYYEKNSSYACGVITMVNNYIMKQQLKTSLIGAYDQFKNMTDAYFENDQLKSIRLSNGNECVKTSNQTFACKFSVE